MSVLRRSLWILSASSILFAAVSLRAAPETDVPGPDERRRQEAAERATWWANCATTLGTWFVFSPGWGARANAARTTEVRKAIEALEADAVAKADRVDELLLTVPGHMPGISASLGVARFFQALYPSAHGDGRRHEYEEQGRYPKWLAAARDPATLPWTRDFVSAVTEAAKLTAAKYFWLLPEPLKERLSAAARLERAMPPKGWVEEAVADPTLEHRFSEGE